MRIIFSLMLLIISFSTWSKNHVARIVKMENDSTIYVPLTGEATAQDKLVKYLDQVFKIVPAKKGMKLDNGYVVNTGSEAKLKIIFNNGDHFFVSPNTQYQLNWSREVAKADDPGAMNLIRGAVRGLIEKEGPRSGLKITTKSTVLGVRGTDFQVTQRNSGLTQVSVLRGTIEIKDKKDNVRIEAGQTFLKKDENTELTKLTKTELKSMAKVIKFDQPEPENKELQELENKAVTVTMKDIQIYQPELAKQVTSADKVNSETLASTTLKVLEKTAPETRKKPAWEELLDESDPYEKYKQKSN